MGGGSKEKMASTVPTLAVVGDGCQMVEASFCIPNRFGDFSKV